MLKNILKTALPHLIAVIVFAVVAIVYCKPALEGKVLQQSDITQFKGMAQTRFNIESNMAIHHYGPIVCLVACPLIK